MAQFRAKARAVDLLGKGQIADLPTAISELWKNGYDAYGDNLHAHLYMPDYEDSGTPIFVVSDDGVGMNFDEINSKWFILGTDSKSRDNETDKKSAKTLFKPPRVKMGEKGIGRLAVAYLGPQMLMLTKKREDVLHAVFFDWRILENFNLFLEDITIPVRPIVKSFLVSDIFEELKNEFLENFDINNQIGSNPWKDQEELKEKIISDTRKLVLPEFIKEDYIEEFLNSPVESSGTNFVVFQPQDQIIELTKYVSTSPDSQEFDDLTAKYTISSLAGLFNLFKYENPICDTSFMIHQASGAHDLLSYNAFFEPEDFTICDHCIEGEFNAKGVFEGEIRIFEKSVAHTFSSSKARRTFSHGPFKMKLGYVSGSRNESLMSDEAYDNVKAKLNIFSGLYIYRDDFRILPYGRLDNDFLEFEERRGRGAGYYFFAKRRMFGYVEITRAANRKLREKSSREGFVNNGAYRDFRSLLIEFFIDLARKYYGLNSEHKYKDDQLEQLKKLAESQKQEKKREREAKRKFSKALKENSEKVEALEGEYMDLLTQLSAKVNYANVAYEDIESILFAIENCKERLKKLKVNHPVRFKPSNSQRSKYEKYQKSYRAIEEKINTAQPALKEARLKLDIHDRYREFKARGNHYKNRLEAAFNRYQSRINKASDQLRNGFKEERVSFLEEYQEKYGAVILDKVDVVEIEKGTKLLESIFEDILNRAEDRILPFVNHVEQLTFDINEEHLISYYKLQYEEMMKEWEQTHELAQLGIAVEIIDHQFNTLYAQLKESITTLHAYIVQDSKAQRKYKTLMTAFDHLEDNYKLLQPLYRTTGRVRRNVTGDDLYHYALEFFEKRLSENKIKFEITQEGKRWSILSFESILKPVVINIINNAIYWLGLVENKIINIDSDGTNLFISNSGKKIETYLLEDIFSLFYSGRPNGRGIGLYLAKKSLKGISVDIYATNSEKLNKLGGACFVIAPLNHQEKNPNDIY